MLKHSRRTYSWQTSISLSTVQTFSDKIRILEKLWAIEWLWWPSSFVDINEETLTLKIINLSVGLRMLVVEVFSWVWVHWKVQDLILLSGLYSFFSYIISLVEKVRLKKLLLLFYFLFLGRSQFFLKLLFSCLYFRNKFFIYLDELFFCLISRFFIYFLRRPMLEEVLGEIPVSLNYSRRSLLWPKVKSHELHCMTVLAFGGSKLV
jgi:hypothetical protein